MNPGTIIISALVRALGSLWMVLLICLQPNSALAQPTSRQPDLILNGSLSGHDNHTYREAAFRVPPGTTRITLDFRYSGKADRTTLDIGLRDPERFRGWSGGARSRLVIESNFATPSYLPGPLPAGTWNLVIGAPNIRKEARSDYTAQIWFESAGAGFPGFAEQTLKSGAGWYRGDLHAHSGHSDGTCLSVGGHRVPCPVFRSLETARSRGLDFLAITDHNAASQNQALEELAPYFDTLLILPGREITTFQGHANIWGVTGDIPFQLGTRPAPTFDAIATQVHALRGLVSINHPKLPSGEACMGCGWSAGTDWSKVDAIEVVNGGSLAFLGAEGPMSGIPFWESLLDRGFQITAVGGSDNHDPDLAVDKPGALGHPTTFVRADELSQPAILEGLRKGRVFIDVLGLPSPKLEVHAGSGTQSADMGDALRLRAGDVVRFRVSVDGLPSGARLTARGPAASGLEQKDWSVEAGVVELTLVFDPAKSWVRFDVRDPRGALILLGNPVYLKPATGSR